MDRKEVHNKKNSILLLIFLKHLVFLVIKISNKYELCLKIKNKVSFQSIISIFGEEYIQ